MITFRIDVDYPYRSRTRSFFYTAFNIRTDRRYLENAKIIATMINESPKQVKAYWFFTPKTLPDKKLLTLIDNEKHETALHIVNDPYTELALLEKTANKKVNYYTIHGTAHTLARVMWGRFRAKSPTIPKDYLLKSFHELPTIGLDALCYSYPLEKAVKIAEQRITNDYVIYFHPVWLFQRGTLNHRGPFYHALRKILDVDKELDTITLQKRPFFTMARDWREYEKDVAPTQKLTTRLADAGADVFTFIERTWLHTIQSPPRNWVVEEDNIALYKVTAFEEWWKTIGKKTRNMIRKAEKSGVKTNRVKPDEKLVEGIWKIYNETPIRQERGFPHYGESITTVGSIIYSVPNSTYIAAHLGDELAGFIRLIHGQDVTYIDQILSLQRHLDKAINNALIAKAIEHCANTGVKWVMYGRMGNHPTLDAFKKNNGFSQCKLRRFYIPLTAKGKGAIALHLHREMKDTLPLSVKAPLFPVYNWISRTRMRLKLALRNRNK